MFLDILHGEGVQSDELKVRRGERQISTTCNIDGYPTVSYRWIYKNLTIQVGRTLDLASNKGVQMFGTFTCLAENSFGKLEYVVNVKEIGK